MVSCFVTCCPVGGLRALREPRKKSRATWLVFSLPACVRNPRAGRVLTVVEPSTPHTRGDAPLAHRTCLVWLAVAAHPIGVTKLVLGSSSSPSPAATWPRRVLARRPCRLPLATTLSDETPSFTCTGAAGHRPPGSGSLHVVFRAIRRREELGRCTARRPAVQPESPRPAETSLANPARV